jgi:hypothetical protein
MLVFGSNLWHATLFIWKFYCLLNNNNWEGQGDGLTTTTTTTTLSIVYKVKASILD